MSSLSTGLLSLDGTTLEGGGQLLRLALSLSSLTHIPVHITDIRGKRGPKSAPHEGGGLKASHLSGVKWLAQATGAKTEGMEIKSRELTFEPTRYPEALAESMENLEISRSKKVPQKSGILWQNRYDGETLIRKDSYIPASTPGSIFLILQAILPHVLFSTPRDEASSGVSKDKPLLHRIIIDGGSNVSKSPSFEYVDQVLLPMLQKKVGIPPIRMKLNKRGWTHGGNVIGSITFDVTPFPYGFSLPSFSFTDRGEVTSFHVSILAPGTIARNSVREKITNKILMLYPETEIFFPVDEDSGSPKRLYLLLVAETSNGYRLGRDWMYDRKATASMAEQKNEQLVEQVWKELEAEITHGGCVDEYMQDQLVVFQALAKGQAEIDDGKGRGPSLHTKTAKWVAEQVLGVGFDEKGACKGVNFRVGEKYWERVEEG
ncbi:MAG: hypothetical protein HETSPECPRED_009401 [Heterodermia speciosa]|uniref:RNA 3'-terminal phosphate cyclase domain-containing protein n=1 Tax=Heterodermia speciosa TaxID=116794 RepID=A0A8H3G885_9LECA|nr:MAG: hypothetical protein HETSPECPRED_009401 [Heterodermia speciosa]